MTVTNLGQLVDVNALTQQIADNYINVRPHPDTDLWILDYAPRAQYKGHWTPETRLCRGLVVRGSEPAREGNVVVARPFAKFFNATEHLAGQHGLAALPLHEPVTVTAKMDGSLGICYRKPDGSLAIATRGSFQSDQARWASNYFAQHFATVELDDDATYLFEIIYPQNRIVVDYGGFEGLVLLAVIDKATGKDRPLPTNWPGPVVEHFDFTSFDDVLDTVEHADVAEQRTGEGFVVRFAGGLRVKVKYAEYVRLHRILTNVNARDIWQYAGLDALRDDYSIERVAKTLFMDPAETAALAGHRALDNLLDNVPDEFYDWVSSLLSTFDRQVQELTEQAQARYDARPGGDTRAVIDYINAQPKLMRSILFAMHNGKPFTDQLWRAIQPPPVKATVAANTAGHTSMPEAPKASPRTGRLVSAP